MRVNLAIVVFLVAFTLLISAAIERLQPAVLLDTPLDVASEGIKAPEFSLPDLTGRLVDLKDFDQRVVLLNFWASWCLPCVAEFPQLVELAERLPEILTILAVSVDQDPENIQRFLRRHGPEELPGNLIVLHDPDKSVTQDLYQTILLPETVVLAPGLILKRKIAGADFDWTAPEMVKELKSLARGR